MPLYKKLTVDESITVLIWKIDESLADLSEGIVLKNNSFERLSNMKSEIHQRGFLSIRHLLKEAGYSDNDLFYDAFGKPFLNDGTHISITHSFIFSGMIISKDKPVGIDIEKQRGKILKIAHKFTPIEEYNTLVNDNVKIRKLTIVWGAKESLYKIFGKKKLLFLHHIYINDFLLEDDQTRGEIRYGGKVLDYTIQYLEFEGFTCIYAY